ncbi:OLC1v1038595C1 [Oldenlandia corymbosa var. corymbosa]|uniref:E3 ubiquitin protein ligase n=1 Tax=Oldenlandia corymbosa var. corymbosa TaxID=529605 RepID=A0AAV1D0S6_OLDCO|nr:OLC1v1038595C1 [Oldenlandia corymbosa var. corymbosa]
MGSTGEADRKRRHFSSISPTSAAAKKQPFMPLSEDKKLDAAVLKFQNQKLIQKLETQKVEILRLEEKINKWTEKQRPYENIVAAAWQVWEEVVEDFESHSICGKDVARFEQGFEDLLIRDCAHLLFQTDGCSSSLESVSAKDVSEDDMMSGPSVSGAAECGSSHNTLIGEGEDYQKSSKKISHALQTILANLDSQWQLRDKLYNAVYSAVPGDGLSQQKSFLDLQTEVKNVRAAICDLLSKQKSFLCELQEQKDKEAKNKVELKHLKEELESTIAELEESACELSNLKADKNATKETNIPILDRCNNAINSDKSLDNQKDLEDMESSLKDLLDQSACRVVELKRLHEERIDILKQLSTLQNTLKNFKSICSSKAYLLLKDQVAKAKADIIRYQALHEKLQLEKNTLAWKEKEMQMKLELLDFNHRSAAIADSRISELQKEIQKCVFEKNQMEAKLEHTSREPGRKEVIAELKTLVASFPKEMGRMQSQLSSYKETAKDIHALRADVRSLYGILEDKARNMEKLSARSTEQAADILKLQALIHDLKESDAELKLFLQMYNRESVCSRDVLDARDLEYKAWANVQSLKTSLDEHNLELRVKCAIEAEATSQQRLAATEAEIAELRQRREASKREEAKLSDTLKFKHEETEAYLSEIETIGQAYDDMQTQNQQLLQQITERDDYNIKLVLEGVKSRQLEQSLLLEKQTIERTIQQANASVEFHNIKAAKFEDQLRLCSDQVQRLAENRVKNTVSLENNQKKIVDLRKSAQQLRESVDESQSKVDRNRVSLAEMQIETERERFDRKREEEELEAARLKVSRLKSQMEGSSVLDKLRQEVKEYREILKCSICLDRRKEVVISKCYHLFCNTCIQRVVESRHRKCPTCAASFSANDVKPVYI